MPVVSDKKSTFYFAAAGYIYWHAYPFNGELELHNAFVLDAALNLTFSLDDYFGIPHKQVRR